jgi:hypothetical protein
MGENGDDRVVSPSCRIFSTLYYSLPDKDDFIGIPIGWYMLHMDMLPIYFHKWKLDGHTFDERVAAVHQ